MNRSSRKPARRGLFITLEGPEGSGKSTQIRHLALALRRAGYNVVQTREPGGTTVAEAIRHTLLSSSFRETITPEAETFLILAARSQHVAHLIAPALQRGAIVLCDRFSDSTIAYQGIARGLNLEWLQAANAVATDGLEPDLTLLLDVPVLIGLARRRKGRGKQNRLDRESTRFHRLVRQGFMLLAKRQPRRIFIVNANQPEEGTRAKIVAFVLRWITRRRRPHRS